jgi:methylated-DNA-[protein]-cysteine S-methyltransferase
MNAAYIDTPLGTMLAVGDTKQLYLLEFVDSPKLVQKLKHLCLDLATLKTEITSPLESIKRELKQYFEGSLKEFETPLCINGTLFQKEVWEALKKIPYGKTVAYFDIAKSLGKERGFRAVALANARNRFAIVIPCHRVKNKNGALGGYSSGIGRKKWLLAHEST